MAQCLNASKGIVLYTHLLKINFPVIFATRHFMLSLRLFSIPCLTPFFIPTKHYFLIKCQESSKAMQESKGLREELN